MDKEITIEDNFNNIEQIISEMESGEVSLEKTFELYSKGLKLVKECNDKIQKVEKKMIVIESGQTNE